LASTDALNGESPILIININGIKSRTSIDCFQYTVRIWLNSIFNCHGQAAAAFFKAIPFLKSGIHLLKQLGQTTIHLWFKPRRGDLYNPGAKALVLMVFWFF